MYPGSVDPSVRQCPGVCRQRLWLIPHQVTVWFNITFQFSSHYQWCAAAGQDCSSAVLISCSCVGGYPAVFLQDQCCVLQVSAEGSVYKKEDIEQILWLGSLVNHTDIDNIYFDVYYYLYGSLYLPPPLSQLIETF